MSKISQLKNKEIVFVFVILILSFLTRFLFFGLPPQVVFDEVYFGKFINYYLKGEYFFDVHPPLGKQIILIGALLGKYKGDFPFEKIGENFSGNSYFYLRLMPNIFGSFIPLVVYFFLRSLKVSSILAFFGALFLIFENSLLVQSRFILIDSFLIFFGFLALAFFFSSRDKRYNLKFLIPSAFFLGASFSVKWTAIGFFIFLALIFLFDLIKEFSKALFFKIILFFFISFLIYFCSFWLHFRLLPNSGPGDVFMSREFLSWKKNIFGKFLELNLKIYEANQHMRATHPFSSRFYEWPFMSKPIFYWTGNGAKIYFFGNLILWWLSSLAVFFSLFWFKKNQEISLLLLGYFSLILPFFFVKRVTFLYHYLPALIFAISLLVCLVGKMRHREKILFLILLVAIFDFVYFSKLSYGLP